MSDPVVYVRSPSDWVPTTVDITAPSTGTPFVTVVGNRPWRQTIAILNTGSYACLLASTTKPANDQVTELLAGESVSLDTEGGVWAAMSAVSTSTTLQIIETYNLVTGGPSRVDPVLPSLGVA